MRCIAFLDGCKMQSAYRETQLKFVTAWKTLRCRDSGVMRLIRS